MCSFSLRFRHELLLSKAHAPLYEQGPGVLAAGVRLHSHTKSISQAASNQTTVVPLKRSRERSLQPCEQHSLRF